MVHILSFTGGQDHQTCQSDAHSQVRLFKLATDTLLPVKTSMLDFILKKKIRVFKLVRHFAGLQSLLHTLQQAYQVHHEWYRLNMAIGNCKWFFFEHFKI